MTSSRKKSLSIYWRSLSVRIGLWVVLGAALLFNAALGYMFYNSRRAVWREATVSGEKDLRLTEYAINEILEHVELCADNMEWVILENLDDPDALIGCSLEIVKNNPSVSSCSISMEPYTFREYGKYFSSFAYRTQSGRIGWEQEGDDGYRYFEMPWYALARDEGRSLWTDPYYDKSGIDDEEMLTERLVSYCRPLYKADSTFVGVLSLDIYLPWLSETVSQTKPYPNSYCVLVSADGSYLVHPNPSFIFYHSIYDDAGLTEGEKAELAEALREGKPGMTRMVLDDGVKSCVFFCTIESTGWGLGIVCPEKDIFLGFNTLRNVVVAIVLLGLIIISGVFMWIINNQLEPLRVLAHQAGTIATGKFDEELPVTNRKDEIGLLNRSFRIMQTSLARYVTKLTEETASRERIARELQIARNIQMGMVPHDFTTPKALDLYASMKPAREVGGDLYDFFIQNEKLYVCIGDVSGKGIPASLIMAVTRGMFRILARQELSPVEIAGQINDTLAEENEELLFVTMFFSCTDLRTGRCEFCNCGHNAPVLLLGDGTPPFFLDCKPNTAIGVIPGFKFEGQEVPDVRGRVLFLYTDGLNEAENADYEQFGNEAMLAEIGRKPFTDCRSLVEQMNDAVACHVDGAEPSDDLTMLCVNVKRQG